MRSWGREEHGAVQVQVVTVTTVPATYLGKHRPQHHCCADDYQDCTPSLSLLLAFSCCCRGRRAVQPRQGRQARHVPPAFALLLRTAKTRPAVLVDIVPSDSILSEIHYMRRVSFITMQTITHHHHRRNSTFCCGPSPIVGSDEPLHEDDSTYVAWSKKPLLSSCHTLSY